MLEQKNANGKHEYSSTTVTKQSFLINDGNGALKATPKRSNNWVLLMSWADGGL